MWARIASMLGRAGAPHAGRRRQPGCVRQAGLSPARSPGQWRHLGTPFCAGRRRYPMETRSPSWIVAFGASASNDGALLFQRFGDEVSELAWVDRAGAMTGTVGSDQGRAAHPALSPDEQRIAFEDRTGIRIHAPDRGVRMPLGSLDTVQLAPVWSPQGDLIYYVTEAARGSDGEGVAIRVVKAEGGVPKTIVDSGFHPWISRDGRYLTYEIGGPERKDIWVRDLQAPTRPSRKFSVGHGLRRICDSPRMRASEFFSLVTSRRASTNSPWGRLPGGEDRIQLSNGGVRYLSHTYGAPPVIRSTTSANPTAPSWSWT